jgi:hypothetical protein
MRLSWGSVSLVLNLTCGAGSSSSVLAPRKACSILSRLPDFARVSLARVSALSNLQREGKANKKATEEREERTTAHKTANAILEDQHKHTDTHLPAPPLFDVVYRIPEASLKLARDDRQAGLHYKKQRQAMVFSQSGAPLEEKPKRFPALLVIVCVRACLCCCSAFLQPDCYLRVRRPFTARAYLPVSARTFSDRVRCCLAVRFFSPMCTTLLSPPLAPRVLIRGNAHPAEMFD